MRVAIIIPLYKKPNDLSKNEVAFIKQAKKVLNRRKVFIIMPEFLLKHWKDHIEFELIPFPDNFFKDKLSYSKLLCRNVFYRTFSEFDFIQIIQTDCWIFEDKLDYFMNLELDYIGAPWMKGGFEGNPQGKLWKVGNGGFSLRKVKTFLSILDKIEIEAEGKKPVFKNSNRGIRGVLKNFGIRNNLKHYIKSAPSEDIFWCIYVPQIFDDEKFKISDLETAAHYSFEVHPEFLFLKITRGKLPMGCHNWMNNNVDFWKEYIKN